jgi:hypothetical protein
MTSSRSPLAGQPLTDAERLTLQAMLLYETLPDLASAMKCHVNTVKYRMQHIRAKYGLPMTARRMALVLKAAERGDIILEHGREVRAFMDHLRSAWRGHPVADAVLYLILREADRFLNERTVKIA